MVGAEVEVDGEGSWTATPAVQGLYSIWVKERPSSVDGAEPAAPRWRSVGAKRLGAGRATELLRAPLGEVLAVEALIDRRAERQ